MQEDIEKTDLKQKSTFMTKLRQSRMAMWVKKHKKLAVVGAILIVLAAIALVPVTRYAIAGQFVKKEITISVLDSQKKSAVSKADVTIGDKTVQTDKNGLAKFSDVSVGYHTATVKKDYYKVSTTNIELPLFKTELKVLVNLEATGRLSSIRVVNLISGEAVAGATINAGISNKALTDINGNATIVIPANKSSTNIEIEKNNYLSVKAQAKADDLVTVKVAPKGAIYFLSKRSGKIDVMQTNLDGSGRKVVAAGTGSEDDNDTSLLASQDWRYLALKAKRTEGKPASIYLIDTQTNKLSQIDTGDISTSLIGWSGHNFWYSIDRNNVQVWQAKRTALKTFDADSQQLQVVDESSGSGSGDWDAKYESFSDYYIRAGDVIYTKTWNAWAYSYDAFGGKTHKIMSVGLNGTNLHTVAGYSTKTVQSINAKLYTPQEIFFSINMYNSDKSKYLELEGEKLSDVPNGSVKFNKPYPTYIVAPSGNQVFWKEERDGKNALLIGDSNAANSKLINGVSELTPYGWFSDKYVLVQKNNSELYITTPSNLKSDSNAIKVSDYHRPGSYYSGYGYGYGGQ